jgi:hypothetical protein
VAGAVAEIVDAGEAADLGVLRIGGAAAAVPGGLALEGLDVEVGDLLAGQEVLAACRAAARSARLKDVRLTVAAWAPLPSPAASAAASIGPKSRAGTKVRMEKPL